MKPAQSNLYLLVHTMTITQCEYEVEAQYYHAFQDVTRIDDAKFVGRRFKLKIHPSLLANRRKSNLQRLFAPDLRTLMRRNSSKIKHHIRTIPMYVNQLVFNHRQHFSSLLPSAIGDVDIFIQLS